jgi:hypothetical protein
VLNLEHEQYKNVMSKLFAADFKDASHIKWLETHCQGHALDESQNMNNNKTPWRI